MFSGIIEEVGAVRALEGSEAGVSMSIRASIVLEDLSLGDSVSVDGACLTVTDLDPESFAVDLSPETLRRTAFSSLQAGMRVSLERAVRVGDRIGGHYVQGHVDGVGGILHMQPEGDSLVASLEVPSELASYIVEKGFVAVDGVSLTVTERDGNRFSVALVPYTREHIALVYKHEGDRVNVEVDIIAKYVENLLQERLAAVS